MKIVSMILSMLVSFTALSDVSVTRVAARQRYPWSGQVDIEVVFRGSAEEIVNYELVLSAKNNANNAAFAISHIEQIGEDVVSSGTLTRRFVWDADKDLAQMTIASLTITMDLQQVPGSVQLWENGPYFATCNVGAEKPEDYGYYFWWGDTVGYKRNSSNSRWVSVTSGFTFWFLSSSCRTWDKDNSALRIQGYIDSNDNLTRMFDAATAHLGAPWRMPTHDEFSSLWDKCDKTWTNLNGANGYLFKGRGAYSSKSIFLPAAGYCSNASLINAGSCGQYWSSTSYPYGAYRAYNFDFDRGFLFGTIGEDRFYGRSVRPVRESAGTAVSSASTVFSYDLKSFPVIEQITASQRDSIDGKVDVYVTFSGVESVINSVKTSFDATNAKTKAGIPTTNIVKEGKDTISGAKLTRHYVWDAVKDIGKVKIEDIGLKVSLHKPVDGVVQLWESGPYFAECNVGASKPEEYGYYFWWGDTVGYKRAENGWSAVDGSKTGFGFDSSSCPTYELNDLQLKLTGYINSTGNLTAAHDAATVRCGVYWRMPTDAEFQALLSNCDTTWTTRNGVNGLHVEGRGAYSSKSIFLPAAGYVNDSYHYSPGSNGHYLSSTPSSDYSIAAWGVFFDSSDVSRGVSFRYIGYSVRPILGTDDGCISASSGATNLAYDGRNSVNPSNEPTSIPIGTALDNTKLTFTTGGTSSWFGQTTTTHDGTDAMQSGALGNNQSSWMQTTVSGPGTISFWWYVSSETNYDCLDFLVDGKVMASISGRNDPWAQKTYSIGSGSHTIKWQYRKDSSMSYGLDAGFVDQVVWTPSNAPGVSGNYSIRFIRNDGAGTLATNVFAYGVSVNLPTVAKLGFARRGYMFGGWATTTANARNGIAWMQDGAAVKNATTVGKMIDVYAIWKLKSDYYEIRFEKNDGSGKWRALGYEYGKSTALPSHDVGLGWSRAGYTFKGWATSATGAVWKTDKAAVSTAAARGKTLVVYAIWEKISPTYSIRFIRNDGAGTLATDVFTYGVSVNLPTIAKLGFARRGYMFGGWATTTANARNGIAWKQDGAVVKNATTVGKMIDVYAIWKLKSDYYEIRFEKNDGSGKWRALGYEYGKSTALPSHDAGLGWSRAGYTFKGWATSATGAVWKTDKAAVSTAAAKGKTLVVYAIWKKTAVTSVMATAPCYNSLSVVPEAEKLPAYLTGELVTGDGVYYLDLDEGRLTGLLWIRKDNGETCYEIVTLMLDDDFIVAETEGGEVYWLAK